VVLGILAWWIFSGFGDLPLNESFDFRDADEPAAPDFEGVELAALDQPPHGLDAPAQEVRAFFQSEG
jgi:hypothetical protein